MGGFLGLIDGINYYISSPAFTNVLSNLTVPKKVYLGIALFGLITFILHGRQDA